MRQSFLAILLFSFFIVCSTTTTSYSNYIKGDCYNGFGTYIYPNGTEYVGGVKADKKHGQGEFTTLDGLKYIGESKDDKMHGQVKLILADGTIKNGEFKNGVFVNPDIAKLESLLDEKLKEAEEKRQKGLEKLRALLHKDTHAVINYLRPLARTEVPETVLIEVADLIARTIAAEPNISARRRRTWIDTRSGKPVYELDQVLSSLGNLSRYCQMLCMIIQAASLILFIPLTNFTPLITSANFSEW